MGYRVVKKAWQYVRSSVLIQYQRVTDRQTDVQPISGDRRSCCVQPSLGSSTSKSQGSVNQSSHDSKNAVNAVLNDPSKSSQSRSMPSVGTGAGQIFSDIGLYKGVVIALKHIKKDHIQVTRQVLLEGPHSGHPPSPDGRTTFRSPAKSWWNSTRSALICDELSKNCEIVSNTSLYLFYICAISTITGITQCRRY